MGAMWVVMWFLYRQARIHTFFLGKQHHLFINSFNHIIVMAWNCGYIFLAGVLATVMTAAYTMAEYVVAIANVLIIDPERQITNHGITIGIYIGILLLSVIYCYQGIRFSGYLNVFTGKLRKEGISTTSKYYYHSLYVLRCSIIQIIIKITN